MDSVSIIDFLLVEDRLFVINATVDKVPELLEIDLQGDIKSTICSSSNYSLAPEWVSQYQYVSFKTGMNAIAHGIYFPPTNPGVNAQKGDLPPLLVCVHGGPTSVSTPAFMLSRIYWTSRGFAVLELNYRGSTGFGMKYRQALKGQWGICDVEDTVAGASWLAEEGLADSKRLIIRGGSSGGFTTLAALAFHDTFAGGASFYGVSDLEILARDTHKFESRYMDSLIGPYPECKNVYRERSPIHHLDGFNAPLLLLQGLNDPIVPPNQSEMIYEGLKSRGIQATYLSFEGESHGFRKAENRICACSVRCIDINGAWR